jgi:acid phosphatase
MPMQGSRAPTPLCAIALTRLVRPLFALVPALALAQPAPQAPAAAPSASMARAGLDEVLARIEHVVVIYGENRSFDNLFGSFPGADGIAQAPAEARAQGDRDGRLLPVLPPVWRETGAGIDAAFGTAIPNGPFAIDGEPAKLPLSHPTRDLVHRYYQNIEQIDGGRNDRFAALSDAGALSMGHYDGSRLAMWAVAREFTLADRFFMGVFGGSYANHLWFACACVAHFDGAPETMKSVLDAQGRLARTPSSPASALEGPVQWVRDGPLTPDGFAVNTVQPPYQPSGVPPSAGADRRFADSALHPLPPQDAPTIGDRLSERGVRWAWYAGGWGAALADGTQDPGVPRRVIYTDRPGTIDFQPHHQPYNYFRAYAPGSAARAEHLRDYSDLVADIDGDRLPQVVFYKPEGDLNEHSGYTDVASGDAHIAALIGRIRDSKAWGSTLIIVTYDENGGYWDHVAPPSGEGWSDRWGPGTRIPAILVSPYVKKGFVDHTVYDTGSIHRLLVRRFGLRPLPDARTRMGDLTNALDLR